MNSMIYSGRVMHARRTPVQHQWVFPYIFYLIDLEELTELDRSVTGFGHNRWRPVALHDRDYLREKGSIRDQLAEFIDTDAVDRILLVTCARFLARVFNPVSFYYCLGRDGTARHMVAEVNNTFGERHLYLMEGGADFPLHCRHNKQFHVSPFNDMQGYYEFTFSAPERELKIAIRLIRDGVTVMDAAMWGSGQPLTTTHMRQALLRHPFTAALTMPRIIRQAALLRYRKKLPVFRRPPASSRMTIKEHE